MDIEEHQDPKDLEDPVPDSPHSDVQREEYLDHVPDSIDPLETLRPLERPVFPSPAKRRPAWL